MKLEFLINAMHLLSAAARGGEEAFLSLLVLLVLAAVMLQKPKDSGQQLTASRSEPRPTLTPAPPAAKSGSARSRRNWHPSISIDTAEVKGEDQTHSDDEAPGRGTTWRCAGRWRRQSGSSPGTRT